MPYASPLHTTYTEHYSLSAYKEVHEHLHRLIYQNRSDQPIWPDISPYHAQCFLLSDHFAVRAVGDYRQLAKSIALFDKPRLVTIAHHFDVPAFCFTDLIKFDGMARSSMYSQKKE